MTEGGFNFLWVVDFPLFEALDDRGQPRSRPTTRSRCPTPRTSHLLDGDPADLLDVRSQAYDLVLNGWELGSGSVRIHRPDIQQQIFGLLGIGEEEAQAKFGFLLDAFRYGAPPHAGFAFGIDRLVALLAGEENIREVIAFPKTQSGADPLTSAPDRDRSRAPRRARPPAAAQGAGLTRPSDVRGQVWNSTTTLRGPAVGKRGRAVERSVARVGVQGDPQLAAPLSRPRPTSVSRSHLEAEALELVAERGGRRRPAGVRRS